MRKIIIALFASAALLIPSVAWTGVSSADTPAGQQSTDWVLGTFTLAPHQGLNNMLGIVGELLANFPPVLNIKPPCEDCDITSITPDLTDTNGNSVNMDAGPMLHHMVLGEQLGLDQACTINPDLIPMRRIFASGNERTTIPPVDGYGIYIPKGERYIMLKDLMNYSNTTQTVQVRMHVTYIPGNTLKPITPVWLDETGCSFPPSYFNVPAGQSHQTMTWTSNVTGKLIGLGGHVHENGVHISATDVTTNTPLCDSIETQMNMNTDSGPETMVTGMTKCIGSGANPVAIIHKGDKIQLDSYYNAPKPEQGVMGIMIMYMDTSST